VAESAGAADVQGAGPMSRLFRRPDVAETAPAVSLGVRTALSTVGVLVQGAQRFLYTLLLGRLAGPALVGTVNSLFSLALFASLLWPAATGAAAAKFVAAARGRGDEDGARAMAAFLARRTVVSSLLCAVPAVVVAAVFLDAGPATLVSLAGLVLAYSGFMFVRGLQFGTGQIPRATAWDVGLTVATLGGVLIVLVTRSPAVLLLPFVVGYGVFAVQGWPRRTSAQVPRAARREADGFVLLGVLGNVASGGFLQLSMVVAGASDTPERAGYYAVALSLATPASLFARSLSMVLFPAMAEAIGRGDLAAVRHQADLGTRTLVATMVPLFGVLAVLAGPVVRLLYGPEFEPSAPLLVVLLLAVMLVSVAVAATNSLTSRSQAGMRVSAFSSAAGALLGIGVWVALVPGSGVDGVAVGYLVGTVVIAGSPMAVAWRWDRHRWGGLSVRLAAGVLLVGVALAVQARLDGGLLADVAVAAGLVVVWALVAGRELVTATRSVQEAFRRPGR
jgi:O-antigen/teichoic acid export membrane protein